PVPFYVQQPEMCPGGCIAFTQEGGLGIDSRATTRSVNGSVQQATTTYVRTYAGTPCDLSHLQNCQIRVDVWEPPSNFDGAQNVRVSRSTFPDGFSSTSTAAEYGR